MCLKISEYFMEKDNNIYIKHILDAIADIEKYISGKSFAEFQENTLIQDGVIRKIEIIGEAAKQMSDKFKKEHQEIPWRQVVGLRNKLIHEYFGVDLEAIWLAAQKDLLLITFCSSPSSARSSFRLSVFARRLCENNLSRQTRNKKLSTLGAKK